MDCTKATVLTKCQEKLGTLSEDELKHLMRHVTNCQKCRERMSPEEHLKVIETIAACAE